MEQSKRYSFISLIFFFSFLFLQELKYIVIRFLSKV